MADGHCGTCGARWQSAALHHCTSCHLGFGSADAFDRHRSGPYEGERLCIPESHFTMPYGRAKRPMLVLNEAGAWIRPPTGG